MYKARDTKLDRFVALKFLPSQLTATESEKSRFIQEAKAASALNHPNVCTIYDILENEGQLFIVMEYVDGATLRGKHNLSVKQVIDVGAQAAEGVAAAHEKGIVHRDIKPENIMLTKSGVVKVMDFGLAKLNKAEEASRLTKAGTTLGTVGYMSPEQVQGQDVDHRSDIFSLGVVLYELLSGESPFKGVHETAIMYEIVNVDPPPMSSIRHEIAPELDDIILECLEKEKDDRCQSARELAKDLRKARKSTGHERSRAYVSNADQAATGEKPRRKSSGTIAIQAFDRTFEINKIFRSAYFLWSLIGILLASVIYFAVWREGGHTDLVTSVTSVNPPPGIAYTGGNIQQASFEISHDGKSIVFIGSDTNGSYMLYIRRLNSEVSRPLPGTGGAFYPFWSYDDRSIGYFVSGKLMRVDLSTGLTTEICSAAEGRGGSWNQNDQIVFARDAVGGLYLVPASGGVPKEIIKNEPSLPNESLRFPCFLPDGKHFVYSIEMEYYGASPGDLVKIGSIDSDVNKVILHASTNAEYADNHLFFTRQSVLLCQRFDLSDFTLQGKIHTIAGNVDCDNTKIKASFSVSSAGDLVYQHGSAIDCQLVLLDPTGKETALPVKTSTVTTGGLALVETSLSPDKQEILYLRQGATSSNTQIWKYDLRTRLSTKLTFNDDANTAPCWSPDGKEFAFTSGQDVYIESSNGAGGKRQVYRNDTAYYKITTDWSSDGSELLVNDLLPNTGYELVTVNARNTAVKTLVRGQVTLNQVANGKFSRDMKWVLYASNRSGSMQLYVSLLKNPSSIWQVSTNGGFKGWWVDNDEAIIYETAEGNVYEESVNGTGDNFVAGTAKIMFSESAQGLYDITNVSSDGRLLVGAKLLSKVAVSPLTFVQNWSGLIAGSRR